MSEELRRGIPKGYVTGKKEYTNDEKKQNEILFEKILRQYGILKDKNMNREKK